jgi:hypothetical protein
MSFRLESRKSRSARNFLSATPSGSRRRSSERTSPRQVIGLPKTPPDQRGNHYGLPMPGTGKAEYRADGVPGFRSRILLITDGEPTDVWQGAAQLVQQIALKGLVFFGPCIENAHMNVPDGITDRGIRLDGCRFRERFEWLSGTQRSVSAGRPSLATALALTSSSDAPIQAKRRKDVPLAVPDGQVRQT